jgi:hypothetical protein
VLLLEPFIRPALHVFFSISVPLLHPALELVVVAFGLHQLVIGKLTGMHLELTPFVFELIAIHGLSFSLVFGGFILHTFFCTCEVLGK